MTVHHLTITNLTCDACVKVCTMIISRFSGVESVRIDQATGETIVQANDPISLNFLKDRLAEKGYTIVIP